MRATLILNLRTLGAKYWVIPGLMALAAIVLAILMVTLDRILGDRWFAHLPWMYGNEPSGARAVLSTIAGSMITVAGVTFSITIAALATTAATYGPRLISNFMQDRGNQITLGTFIATFLFCLLVLRTVRSADESLSSFVPHLAIIVALVLALASLAVLIYFIHHVPESIHVSNIVARVGRDLGQQIEDLFPDQLGEAGGAGDPAPERRPPHAVPVRAREDGYIKYVDAKRLMQLASEHDLRLHLDHRPGDFVRAERDLVWVEAPVRADQEVLDRIHATFVIGGFRSQEQDILYLVNRLVEVAARALSPGMNDLFTATNAIDWLGGGLASLARRDMPADQRRDADGRLRIVARSRTFEDVASAIFDQLRPYVAGDRNAALHLMRTLAGVAEATADRERRAVLLSHAKALRLAVVDALDHPRDVEQIEGAYADVLAALARPRGGSAATPAGR
ncbi:MAG TPA: DUF2254 domain-containing protein [Geminicoccaceae bacterium]